jgi:hypothetical protein
MKIWLAVPLLVAASGCGLYFGGDDDPSCDDRVYAAETEPYQAFYDPNIGACINGGGGGCYDGGCGTCEATNGLAQPNMGLCYSSCSDLSESACHAQAGCIASYSTELTKTDDALTFTGCWQVAPYGPDPYKCEGLDANSCATQDKCSIVHEVKSGVTSFSTCITEPYSAACALVDCTAGYHCEEICEGNDNWMSTCAATCVQDTDCTAVDCGPGYTCAEVCDDGVNPKCGSVCVPDPTHDPGSCTGAVNCFANPPACPSGTTAGIRNGCWTGYCIPNSACGPNDPGVCYSAVTCDSVGPNCPAGTTAGINSSGCWSGYCIPTSECGATSCASLTTESSCTSRMDCGAVYTGTNCVCTADGCSCQTVTFDHCETL